MENGRGLPWCLTIRQVPDGNGWLRGELSQRDKKFPRQPTYHKTVARIQPTSPVSPALKDAVKTKIIVTPLAILLMLTFVSGANAKRSDMRAAPIAEPPFLVEGKEPPDCIQIPPESFPPIAQPPFKQVRLNVRVLSERPDLGLARDYFETRTKGAFSRIGIELVPRYHSVAVPAGWAHTSPDQQTILEFMRSLFGGARPKGTDLVYFFTRYWAGGFADCIGGIRDRAHGFAFGSTEYATEGIVPMPTVNEGDIAAHELGHLLGAHHHYANCVEPAPALPAAGGPCTTMWPLAAGISTVFGTLERSFIRSYAETYG